MGLTKNLMSKELSTRKGEKRECPATAAFQSANRLLTDLKLQTDKSKWGEGKQKDPEADLYLAAG